MSLQLARDLPPVPYNTTIKRFDPRYWTIDYNALMVATILPVNDRGFRVVGQWRTNSDFLGVRWTSEDTDSHEYFRYATDNDYAGTILAFRHNTPEPSKFTATLTTYDLPLTYRLAPYAWDEVQQLYVCIDELYSTGRTYPADVMYPKSEWFDIPGDDFVPFNGRTDYIFILDFDDARLYSRFDGPRIPPQDLSRISLDTVEWQHGLGRDATIINMTDVGNGEVMIEIAHALPGAVLVPGDNLSFVYRFFAAEDGKPGAREDAIVVKRWDGFGTNLLRVWYDGVTHGVFEACDAFYSRYLKTTAPAQVTNSSKYFVDMKVTGQRLVIGKKDHPQPAHGLMMTSGFDDNYQLTPARQVEMVYKLGYRGYWTKYIGMSHYFNGRTAYMDRITGEIIAPDRSYDVAVVFAGQSQAAGHFVLGYAPNRGADEFVRKMVALFGNDAASLILINGATGSTAADRACAVNPDSAVFDPDQTTGAGGLWWWDLEANLPGPALIQCVENVGVRKPKIVVWSQGDQDAAALRFPDGRDPVPSIARSKAATLAVFAYMRSLWGATLPIMIQQQGWSWGLEQLAVVDRQAIYLYAAHTTWGDVRLTWLSYRAPPAGETYTVEILSPQGTGEVLGTIQVAGTHMLNGLVYADFTVEDSIPIFGFPPTYMIWRVRTNGTNIVSSQYNGYLPLDDSPVKKLVMFGGQSNAFGHFSNLSGLENRRDKVSAAQFRQELAARLGLTRLEVMPINVSLGSSAADIHAQLPEDAQNYWWDLDANKPGPRMNDLMATMKALTIKPDAMVWAQGEAEVSVSTGLRPDAWSTPQRFVDSTKAIFAYIRTQLGLPHLPIWFQTLARAYYGVDGSNEPLGAAYQIYRNKQVEMSVADPDLRIGSWTEGDRVENYVIEEIAPGWIHYKSFVYHDAASELANAIANNLDLTNSPPFWTTVPPVANIAAHRSTTNSDIIFTWDALSGVQYRVVNRDVTTNDALLISVAPTNTLTFTTAEQVAAYGFATNFVLFSVQAYISPGLFGPQTLVTIEVAPYTPPPPPKT